MFAPIALTLVCLAAPPADKAPPKAAADTPSAETLDVEYCRAQLRLAKANLSRLEQINKKVPRTVPAVLVAERREDVATAQVRLQQAEAGSKGNEFYGWLRRARADLSEAETNWKKAVAANRRAPDTFEAVDVERYRLRAEVYRLQYKRGLALVDAPHEAQLAWRVELLTNELERVKEEATRVMPAARNYYYTFPAWW